MATQKPEDGGSAFPSHGTMGEVVESGMSLRDWFAGHALAGFAADPSLTGRGDAKDFVREAYELADAMLAERAKATKVK